MLRIEQKLLGFFISTRNQLRDFGADCTRFVQRHFQTFHARHQVAFHLLVLCKTLLADSIDRPRRPVDGLGVPLLAALLNDPGISDGELLEHVPAPDFPTGGEILGRSGARKALMEGRGSVIVRGKTSVEQVRSGKDAIIIHEIPYQVNKASMIEKIADLVREKRIEGISDLRDESDRSGMRVVVELKKDANADVILNQLFRWSPLQTSFGVNMLALIGGRPQQAGLRTFLETFIAFRKEVVVRRTKFDLKKARDRAHVLVGLAVAVANIDEIIRLIRNAPDPATAREQPDPLEPLEGDVEELVNRAVEARPGLEALDARVAALNAQVDASQGAWLPDIALTGRYIYARPNQYFFTERNAFKGTWEAGVVMRWSPWDGGAKLADTRQAQAQLEAARAQLASARDRVAVEVTRQHLEAQRAAEAVVVARQNVDGAEEALRVVRRQYAEGAALSAQVLDAEQALRRAEARSAQALADRAIARAALLNALGRVW